MQKLLQIKARKMSMLSSVLNPTFFTGLAVGITATYVILRKWKVVRFKANHAKYHEENFEFPDTNDEYRLVIGVRNDLKMQKGKVAAQCGHASVAAYVKAANLSPRGLEKWLSFGGTKITVKLDSEQELIELEQAAKKAKILTCVVRDAGQTQVAPGSRTVLALGPAPKSALDRVSGHLKLY